MHAFPELPIVLNDALLLGALLLAGVTFGEIARRVAAPPVSGYIVAGLLVGPLALDLPLAPLLEHARLVVDLAVGLVLFELGRRVDLRWMRVDRSLLATSVAESGLSFAAMLVVLLAFDLPATHAAIAAAIGVASSPAVAWLVMRDAGAQGQVTERCLALVALNTLCAFLLVAFLLSTLHLEQGAGWTAVVLHPLWLIVGSVAVGAATGYALLAAAGALDRRPEPHLAVILAAVLVAVGLCHALGLSVFLALLVAGVLARNVARPRALLAPDLGSGGARTLLILLFVITGAAAPLPVPEVIAAAAGYVVARGLGKWFGAMSAAALAPLPWRQSALVGATLMPMSGIAAILLHDVARIAPAIGAVVVPLVGTAILVFELVGPPLMQRSLVAAGDVPGQAS